MAKKQYTLSDRARKQQQRFNSKFGIDYTERNRGTNTEYAKFLHALFTKHGVRSVLEVGCNLGGNLELFIKDPGIKVHGVDIQSYAIEQNKKTYPTVDWRVVNACEGLPFDDSSIDLVFTVGVLIHIPPEDLPNAMREICRVAKKHVFFMEYPNPEMKEIVWRGEHDAAWKGPYQKLYLDIHPGLSLVEKGKSDEPGNESEWCLFAKK